MATLSYNGENDVSTFSRLFLIRSFFCLQVTRTCIKSRTSSNFGQTDYLAALERLKDLQWENAVAMLARSFFILGRIRLWAGSDNTLELFALA